MQTRLFQTTKDYTFICGVGLSLILHLTTLVLVFHYTMSHSLNAGAGNVVFVSFDSETENSTSTSGAQIEKIEVQNKIEESQPVPVQKIEEVPALVIPKRIISYKPPKLMPRLEQVSYNPQNQGLIPAANDVRAGYNNTNIGSGSNGNGGASPSFTPKPPYPPAARRAGFEGRVLLKLVVGTNGRPRLVEVAQSSGREDCDESARKTVLNRWKFDPMQLGGFAVETTETISVKYVLE